MLVDFQVVESRLIFIVAGNHLCQLSELKGLNLINCLWLQYIVTISQISVRELNLIQFVFNHYLVRKHVIQRTRISVIRCK